MKKYFLMVCSLFFFVFTMQAQNSKTSRQKEDAGSIKELLEAKEYIFKAQTVNPSRGALRQLTSNYDVQLLGDSVVSYLPYFGRAYTAPINPANSGIQFTSTQFEYELKQRKKGWDITLRPRDVNEVQQLILSVSQSGRATLQVLSTNREPISFNGYIAAKQ